MFTMMDSDEVLHFDSVNDIATYLGQVASSEYAEKVLTWAESQEQTLWMPNGRYMDAWYKK